MEIKTTIHTLKKFVRFFLCAFLLLTAADISAQVTVKNYTVKDGKMYIAISKNIRQASLDSFINEYNLTDLDLKQFFKTNSTDSLKKLGWTFEINNREMVVISKPLFAFENINNNGDRIIFTQKDPTIAQRFPPVSSNVIWGVNRFKNKAPFAVKDSVVTFFLRGNKNAQRVYLAGSFNEWDPDALLMTKTDSGWVADVKLGAGKYWYKFVVDGNWQTDTDIEKDEDDGMGNRNSVYFKTNVVFRLAGHTNAKKTFVAGRFNGWNPKDIQMNRTATGWELPMYLADGTYTYRFIADRDWMDDPANDDKLLNEFGEYNSVIRLGKPYVFKLDGYTDAKKVMIMGSFNGWRENEIFMNKTATGWVLPYTLGAGNYEYKLKIDDNWMGNAKTRSNLFVVIEPNHTFRLKGYPNAKKIILAGDFNGWNENDYVMEKEGDEWVITVHLSVGKHLYKYIIDGEWIKDPYNELWEQNEHNTGNSIIWFEK